MLYFTFVLVYLGGYIAFYQDSNDCARSGDPGQLEIDCDEERARNMSYIVLGMLVVWMVPPFGTAKAMTWTAKFKAAGALFLYQVFFSIIAILYNGMVFTTFFARDDITTKLILRSVSKYRCEERCAF